MSESAARKVLKKAIEDTLNQYTRGVLDKQVHVLDVSYTSLLRANMQKDTTKYKKDYAEFIGAVKELTNPVHDYLTAVKLVSNNRGACLLQEGMSLLLVSKNFDAARSFITKVSNSIPTNDSFGVAYRTRNLQEIQVSRKLYRAAGSAFLLKDVSTGKYNVFSVNKVGGTYGLIPVPEYSDVKEVLHFARRTSTSYSVSKNLDSFDNLEVEIVDGKIAVKKRLLSVLDLGHGQGELSPQITPVGQKLSNLLNLGLSPEARDIVEASLLELRSLHNVVSFEFKNTSTDTKASGYVVLSVQNYKRNNLLSISESRLLSELRKNLYKILPDIPGSNTILEDKVEALTNSFISILTGKPAKKIKPHTKPVLGRATPKSTTKSPSTTKVSAPRKLIVVSASSLRNLSGQFYSLASLQRLLDANLAQKIKENMGSGSRRDILNLRSGRFAESAKVERMSQSREGMITAFYTYMKNPYATFSQGGRQEFPRSRDPKLLIAKSIREIAATQVANRMRAVLI